MGDVNQKYPAAASPSAMMTMAISAIARFFLIRAKTVIRINNRTPIASHIVKPICFFLTSQRFQSPRPSCHGGKLPAP